MFQGTKKNVTNEALEEFLLLALYFIIIQCKISYLRLWIILFVDFNSVWNSVQLWSELVRGTLCTWLLLPSRSYKMFYCCTKKKKNMGQEWEYSFFITLFQILKFKPVAISKFPNGRRWALQGLYKKLMHPRHEQWHWDVSAFLCSVFKKFLMSRLASGHCCALNSRFHAPVMLLRSLFLRCLSPNWRGNSDSNDQGMIWQRGRRPICRST